jgi:Ca2+-binding EF-hand superfamily protein
MHRSDADKDGRITLDEFTARAAKRFATLDLNNDGRIAADDLPPGERWSWDKRE